MALAYGSRRTTKDADVVMEPDVAAEILPIAERIAPEFGLPTGWLNQKAAERPGFIVRPPGAGEGRGQIVFETPALTLEVPPPEHMLAMKLAAFRDDTDIADAKLLLRALGSGFLDQEDVWTVVGGFVPDGERDKAYENLYILWEDLHEPA